MLTPAQRRRVRAEVYANVNGCGQCLPFECRTLTWANTLGDTVMTAVEVSGVGLELREVTTLEALIAELALHCPNCGARWDRPADEVGQALQVHNARVLVSVPTVHEDASGYNALSRLWMQVPVNGSDVRFTFNECEALLPTAVAFIGGVAKRIEDGGGSASFAWDTMQHSVRVNLRANGFAGAFGAIPDLTQGLLPYRQDRRHDFRGARSDGAAQGIIHYLRTRWLGAGFVNLSQPLAGAILGNVWEIYTNALEHSGSTLGVFTCGQYFSERRELMLSVIDLGRGIPANVSQFFKRAVPADEAMTWAFKPGTSTVTGTGRGLGLDLLKNFVVVSGGRLEVRSGTGHADISRNGQRYQQVAEFPGTSVRIVLRCDAAAYQLASESDSTPFF